MLSDFLVVIEAGGKVMPVPPQLIAVDPSKTYRLSGWMKSTDANSLGRAMIEGRFFDADQRDILPWTVRPITGIARLATRVTAGPVL